MQEILRQAMAFLLPKRLSTEFMLLGVPWRPSTWLLCCRIGPERMRGLTSCYDCDVCSGEWPIKS